MNDSVRVLVAIAAAFLVLALVAWARGNPHHRGTDVGSLESRPLVSSAFGTPQA